MVKFFLNNVILKQKSILLQFGTSGFVYIYREDNIKDKKLLPRSVSGYFVGTSSDLVLIKVFIPLAKSILHVQMDDFQIQDKTGLLGAEILLDVIGKQLAKEQEEAKAIQLEAHLVNAFSTVPGYQGEVRYQRTNKFRVSLSISWLGKSY